MTSTIAHRASVIDRLITEWGILPGDVMLTSIYVTDVVVHLRAPLAGMDWDSTPGGRGVTYAHKMTREEVEITILAWVPNDQEVTA